MKSRNLLRNTAILSIIVSSLVVNAMAQQTLKLYPSTLRVTKGKSKTVTAVYKNSSGVQVNVPISFNSSNLSVATATNDIDDGGFSDNLASIKALTSGTAIVTATYNGLTSNSISVLVDDPAATPIAQIHGDNDSSGGLTITTKVGEPIEINAESSQGIDSIEWNWGDSDKTFDTLSATHSYLQSGTHNLNLKIKNSSGATAIATVSIIVQDFAPPTNTYTVTTAQELINAYNQCNGGEHIVIPSGITIIGHIELPNRNFSDYVTIRASGNMPDIRNRISPNDSNLVVIKGQFTNVPTLKIKSNVSKLRFIGIKFEPVQQTTTDQFSIIEVGELNQTSLSTNPQKIIFQHTVMNPPNNTMVRHGMANEGYKVAVISSWYGNIQVACIPNSGCFSDSNAIYSINGRGSHVYNNSYIEASSENILYGGDTVRVDGHTPTNIEIRRNYFYKRPDWKPNPVPLYNIKNLIEFKFARRVYLEGNVFKNHWLGADGGQAHGININGIVEVESPWTVSEDIIFENNKIINVPSGVLLSTNNGTGVSGYDGRKSNNIRFKNILFDEFNADGPKRLAIANRVEYALFDHVTQIDQNLTAVQLLTFATQNNYGFQMTNSIVGMGTEYQIISYGRFGRCALNHGTNGTNDTLPCNPNGLWNVSNNIFVRYNTDPIINPPSNNCSNPVGFNQVGFVDLANGDYRLSSNRSCYQGQPDPGANIPLLNERTQCTVSGIGTSCSMVSTQIPYPGANIPSITSTIEAENFDRGGQGVAYNDTFGNTGSSAYRTNPIEQVDIQQRATASNGYIVFEAGQGEWMEYTVNVPKTKNYKLAVRYSSEFNNGRFHIEVCEPNGTGIANCVSSAQLTANSTGSWGTFQNLTTSLNLTAGTRILRLVMDTNSPNGCGCIVANFDSITALSSLFDYDGDGKADLSVFRPSNFNWYFLQSINGGTPQTQFGASSDIITPADFDGDGKTDVAIWTPSTGLWKVLRSSDSTLESFTFGANGDIPVQADYDGDGKADYAIWRPSNATWYLQESSAGLVQFSFGVSSDKPVVGDYDGDGKADAAIFRPSNGQWWINQSTNGVAVVSFGNSSDKTVQADYTGDGKTDVAFWRPSTGEWFILKSEDYNFYSYPFGTNGDIPVPADYDGDGKSDTSVFRPSSGVWHLLKSTSGYTSQQHGQNGDIPTPSVFVK